MPDQTIKVAKLPIRLGQFLKLAELVQDGMEAKIRIQAGEVSVNGSLETRRGRQLHNGDRVHFAGRQWLVDEDTYPCPPSPAARMERE